MDQGTGYVKKPSRAKRDRRLRCMREGAQSALAPWNAITAGNERGLRLHIRRRHHSLGPQRLRRPADIASTNAWFKKIAADGTAEPALERQMAA
ncbi:hypothetical protein G8D25_23525 [Ralstonia solanacearum]|nr:hypothetical protein G8D25_23525 [Ralstonia solanacearum]